MANARLMEDNESYQPLLQEKTLKGDFAQTDFSYMSAQSNQDALAALEGKTVGGSSLADELSEAADNDDVPEGDRRLEAELKSMKDQRERKRTEKVEVYKLTSNSASRATRASSRILSSSFRLSSSFSLTHQTINVRAGTCTAQISRQKKAHL